MIRGTPLIIFFNFFSQPEQLFQDKMKFFFILFVEEQTLCPILAMFKQTKKQKMNYSKGNTVTYTKEIMFKGTQEVTAKIVGIFPAPGRNILMLDNGDELTVVA